MVLAVEPSEYAASEVDGVMGGISLQNAYTADVQVGAPPPPPCPPNPRCINWC